MSRHVLTEEEIENIVEKVARRYVRRSRGELVSRYRGLDAGDVAQAARFAILTAIRKAATPLDPAYLRTVADNAVKAEYRKARLAMRPDSLSDYDRETLEEIPDPYAADPAEDAETGDSSEAVWEFVRRALTPSQFEATYLHFRQGLSHDRVAARLGISRAAVRKRIDGGLKTLRSLIDSGNEEAQVFLSRMLK